MRKKRRSFSRRKPELNYRKLFLIATEGKKTEPIYFRIFNNPKAIIRLKILSSNYKTSPPHILQRVKSFLRQEQLKKEDEIWLVIDRDQWPESQLEEVFTGCQSLGFKLAVSNPKFEFWLLLHFEDVSGIINSKECTERLRQHLPKYEKGRLDVHKIIPKIPEAIRRAERKNRPSCKKWPITNGSTVYLLVEKLYVHSTCLVND